MKTAVKEKGLNKWGNILEEIFGVEVNYTEITNKERIAEILDRINNSAQIHMFFPGRGGLGNFMKVQYNGREIDFVENGGKVINRIPIRKLEYNCIGNSPNWSYIRLEAEESNSITGISGYYEEYGELEDGTILNRSMWDEGYYMNTEGERESIPSNARLIIKTLKGSLVIFATRSSYNVDREIIGDAYDGRHNKMTALEFEEYIKSFYEKYKGTILEVK